MRDGQEYIPHNIFIGASIPNWLLKSKNFTAIDKLVFARLMQFSGKDGKCYPKQETIADEIGASPRSVRDSITKLAESGLISVVKPKGKEKLLHMNSCYTFIWVSSVIEGEENDTLRTGKNCRSVPEKIAAPNKENHNKENHKPPIPPIFENLLPKCFKQSTGFIKTWSCFTTYRKEKRKALTPTTTKRLISRLRELSKDDANEAIEILNQTIENSWTGIFEIKQQAANKSTNRNVYREEGKTYKKEKTYEV